MHFKTCPAFVKAISQEADQGIVEMVISTYARDSWGDRVIPGAFADSLAEWKASGDPIPFIFAHQHENPMMYVGSIIEASEQNGDATTTPPTPAGLLIKAEMDLDDPMSVKVFKLLKGRRVKQASFAYDILEAETVTEDGERTYELRKLKLHEGGPCLIGMNQETELLGVKDYRQVAAALRDAKLGRTLSAKNEDLLRSAHESIGQVLSTLEDDGKSGGKSADSKEDPDGEGAAGTPGASGKDDDSEEGKSEDPVSSTLASLDLLEGELALAEAGV